MLAVTTRDLPRDDAAWGFEMKWDGMRTLITVEDGAVRVTSRQGNDATARFPELDGLADALAGHDAVLDGEIVALDAHGRPSFERLQPRMQAANAAAIRRRTAAAPIVVMLFDLLWLDGEPTMSLPYRERRTRLEQLQLAGPAWQTPPVTFGGGPTALAAATRLGFEGVMMKRLDSPYLAGRRSDAWRKRKLAQAQELVVGGWLPGKAGLAGRLGSLLVGYHDGAGALHYAGRVGSGITSAARDALESQLAKLARTTSPFVDAPRLPDPRWVTPELVVDVGFHEWTTAGVLRAPRYRGLRADKAARDVVRELPPDPERA